MYAQKCKTTSFHSIRHYGYKGNIARNNIEAITLTFVSVVGMYFLQETVLYYMCIQFQKKNTIVVDIYKIVNLEVTE